MNYYRRGANQERDLVNALRERGFIAFRSAGSHSPIDVCAVSMEKKLVLFFQCKKGKFTDNQKKKLEKQYSAMKLFAYLTNFFVVTDVKQFLKENFPNEVKFG